MPEEVTKGISSEEFFGLAYPDYSLKPSGISYSLLTKELNSLYRLQSLESTKQLFSEPTRVYNFKTDHGFEILIAWSNSQTEIIFNQPEHNSTKITNLITGENVISFATQTIIVYKDPILIKTW
jgi:hypothetical protein